MEQPTLFITRLSPDNQPMKGQCSACDAEFDLHDTITANEHRGQRLQAMFEEHVKERHSDMKKRSLTHW